MITRKLGARRLLAAGAISVGALAAFGFAASNVVPNTGAGDGNQTISGYTVTNVQYTLATDPTKVDKWEFDIAPTSGAAAARVIKAKILGSSTTYITCTVAAGHATCDDAADSVSVAAADNLRVIAVQ